MRHRAIWREGTWRVKDLRTKYGASAPVNRISDTKCNVYPINGFRTELKDAFGREKILNSHDRARNENIRRRASKPVIKVTVLLRGGNSSCYPPTAKEKPRTKANKKDKTQISSFYYPPSPNQVKVEPLRHF